MLLSQAQERPLGYVERFGVMLHLLVCKGCTNFRAQLDFQAEFFQLLLGNPSDLCVFHRHDLIHDFNHGHVNAHGIVEARKLYADGAGADHEQ